MFGDRDSPNRRFINGYTGVLTPQASIGGPNTGFGSDPAQSSLVLPNQGNNGAYATAGGSTPLQGQIGSAGTVAAWINLANLPTAAGRDFSIAGESQYADDFDLQIDSSDNQLRLYTNAGGYVGAASDFTASSLGQWIFVVGTFSDTGTTDVYINGVLSSSGGPGGHSLNNAPFYVGQSNVFGGRNFDGSIGGVAVFDTQLDSAQVLGLYTAAGQSNGGVPEPAAWALMIAGFGLAGVALRRRRAASVLA